jgi:hypothetical protein
MIALVLLRASFVFADEPAIGKFVKYDAGDYLIVTSQSPSQSARIVENLAKIRAALERLLAVRARPSPLPTTILIASTGDWRRWLEPPQYSSGYFRPTSLDYYIAMNGSQPVGEDLSVVFHEYTHYFLASQLIGKYPPWFEEGLAEVMSNARFTGDALILEVSDRRIGVAKTADWIPFEHLLRIDESDPRYRRHKWGNSFYAQSWLTVHYGMVEDPAFGRQILDYLHALAASVPRDVAAREAFGDDLSLIDRKLRAYLIGGAWHSGSVRLGKIPRVDLPKGRPLDELDSLALVANVALAADVPADRVRPLVEALERRDPDNARTGRLRRELAELEAATP